MKAAARILIRGVVQGVGFRPFLFREAQELRLCGTLKNQGDHVEAVLEGEATSLDRLLSALREKAPPQARIEAVEIFSEEPCGRKDLRILTGFPESGGEFGIPVDGAPCSKCWQEYFDPKNRRYLYPFISCTDCGPRYTVVKNLPFDRKNTAFSSFSLCSLCAAEYAEPTDRRFHAETISCPQCGPRLSLQRRDGSELGIRDLLEIEAEVHGRLQRGEILAMKGVGGFQLIVDARNPEAIRQLRARKRRPAQAFAVLARDLAAVARVCDLGGSDSSSARALTSQAAPIVILPTQEEGGAVLPLNLLSPDAETLGVMLPASPLHQFLLGATSPGAFNYLIVTSGNVSGNPLCLTEDQAVQELSESADFFLTSTLSLEHRIDDSVWISARRGERSFEQAWRLGRGGAPLRWRSTSRTEKTSSPTILGLGGDLKSALALDFGDRVLLSPHIGNLFHYETHRFFEEMLHSFPAWIGRKPELLVVDSHPQYASSLLGRKLAEEEGLRLFEVQHHHAHAAACMEEHGLGEALALVFDGTGWGTDGTLWGGELLKVNREGFLRLGRLRPATLTGGDGAVREPWKQSLARIWDAGGDLAETIEWGDRWGVKGRDLETFRKIFERSLNSISTSSMGRVFDSVAALVDPVTGLRVSYEGQAAIRLEAAALRAGYGRGTTFESYSYRMNRVAGLWEVDLCEVFLEIFAEAQAGRNSGEISGRFHETVFRISRDWLRLGLEATGVAQVVLSGGVFQNQLLARRLVSDDDGFFASLGIQFHEHQRIPPGDGGLAFGQVTVGRWKAEEET